MTAKKIYIKALIGTYPDVKKPAKAGWITDATKYRFWQIAGRRLRLARPTKPGRRPGQRHRVFFSSGKTLEFP